MITAGVDVGNKFTKAVIMKDGKILSRGIVGSGFDQKAAAEGAYDKALSEAGIRKADVQYVMATGAGKGEVYFSNGTVTEVGADTRGANYLFPTGRSTIDVGAEEGRAIKCDANGKVLEVMVDDYDDEVIAVHQEHRKIIKYSCAPCKPTGTTEFPCVRACGLEGIKPTLINQIWRAAF